MHPFLSLCIENYIQMFPTSMYAGLTVHEGPQLAYRIGGFPIANLNSVVRSILTTDPEKQVDEVIEIFEKRGLPFNWVITPESKPENLADLLQQKGLTYSSDLLAMGRTLEGLPALEFPEGFNISEVTSDGLLEAWARVGQASFHLPAQAVQLRIRQFERLLEGGLWPVKLYVGFSGKEAVCGSGLRLTPNSAGVYFVGTVPEHTRKGYGQQITLKSLQDAFDLGHKVGVLMSTAEGLQVYRRLGFEHVGIFQVYIKDHP